jgi:hypothetical protein
MNAYRREFLYNYIKSIAEEKYPKDKNLRRKIDACFSKLSKEYANLKLYKWKENSCFIDSVMAIILHVGCNYWRKLISQKPGKLTDLIKSDSEYCVDLRKYLRKLDKNISQTDFGEAVGIYELLASHYNFQTGSEDPYIVYPVDKKPKNRAIVYSPLMQAPDGDIFHYFADFLAEYEKIGVLVNTGNHYVSYFKSYDGIYYYDDMGTLKKVKKFPDPEGEIFHELVFYVKKVSEYLHI